MKEEELWIWFTLINGVGNKTQIKLLNKYKNVEVIWNLKEKDLLENKFLNKKLITSILNSKVDQEVLKKIEEIIKYNNQNNIKVIKIIDEEYPNKLRNIYDPPVIIYAMGNVELLKSQSVGIIGSRKVTEYGKYVTLKTSYNIAKEGICIISGLAKGIDSFAHIGSIKAKGKIIAVIGNGLDVFYPSENEYLYKEIIKNNGLIISEYEKGVLPQKYNFPARNRIISALSDKILVVEAKEKSGTLITVDFALEHNKEIFVVPGNITSENSIGTNRLIKEGASVFTNVADLIE